MVRHIIFRLVLLVLLAGLTVAGLTGCASVRPDINLSSLPEGYETRVYEVFGMDCPGCHGGVEKLVKKIPNVLQAQANWKKQRLTVYVGPNSELKDDSVYDAIRQANFTVGKRLK